MATGNSAPMDAFAAYKKPAVKHVPVDFDGPLPQPTRDVQTAKADLDRAGYAMLLNVLTGEQAREVRQIVASEIAREEAIDENRVRHFFVDPDSKNRRLYRLPDRHRLFRDIIEHPLALELSKYIMGPTLLNESYLLHSAAVNLTRPGSGAQLIHTDSSVGSQTRPFASRFIWCIDPFDAENGATRLVPGSHLWNDRIDMSGATHYESIPAEAPPGSVIVYTDMLLHGTGANVSTNRERVSVNVGYCPPWCRPLVNFPLVLDPTVMEGTSRTLRQLLGYSSVALGGDYPWESASDQLRGLCVPATMEY
jgi:ectoine hydroxylase-related dioxygenase (phytanoyl-CoA dioxygenase family)